MNHIQLKLKEKYKQKTMAEIRINRFKNMGSSAGG